MKLLTNLIFEPKGKHDPALAYNIKDTVMSADGSKVYFALQDVPENTPLTDEDFWKLQIDLSGSKSAMDEALASFSDYAKIVGTRVKGETAKASGNPVTFLPDAGSLLQPVTVLEPKQAGSGDPYPAGGGRNLLPNVRTVTATFNGITFTNNGDGSYTLDGTASEYAQFVDLESFHLPAGSYVLSVENTDSNNYAQIRSVDGSTIFAYSTSGIFTLTSETEVKYRHIVNANKTVTALRLYPMLRLASDPDATYAPYENIRPFVGYDELGLSVAGKNLLPNTAVSVTKNGLTYTVNNDGSVTVNGTCDSNSFFTICESVKLQKGEYILSGNPKGITYSQVRLYVDKYDSMTESHKFTLTSAQAIRVNIVVFRGEVLNNVIFKPMIRPVSDPDATYEPYQGKFHTVQIGQTVYGGRFDWLTGKLVAEWAMVTLTSNLNWVKSGSAKNGFYLADGNVFVPAKLPYCPVVCNVARYEANVEDYRANYGTIYSDSTVSLNINPAVCGDTLDSFENWLDSTPVQIAYKLATPIEIQLSPTIISAADPEQTNTLYGDGSIDVEYVKPLHVSIEERVAAAVAAAINTEGV